MPKAGKDTPNILLIMVDQLAAPALPVYGHAVVKAPHISALADAGVVFENTYCNFPICAPSRFSMMSGRLPTAIGAFDNAAEFEASIPTMAHYLCAAGYRTILSGKMHFIGPDQHHGYEERLTTDIYPSTFAWTPDWREGEFAKPSGISMRSVVEAGPCVRSLQIDYDDEVEFHAVRRLFDLARRPDERPFFMTASFTHPHPPFVISRRYWDLYEHGEIDMPAVPAIPLDELDPFSRWLHYAHGADMHTVTDAHVRNARHAYYGMISYIDEKVGSLIQVLKDTGLYDNTLILFTGDHGEMLGERGMWYKQAFFEWSARVPLICSFPRRYRARREKGVVSLVDLLPTFLDVAANGRAPEPVVPLDGRSMLGLLEDNDATWPDTAISEYTAEGARVPCRMIRQGRYKYVYVHGYDEQLFDLEEDPRELTDLAGRADLAPVQRQLRERLLQDWDPEEIHARVLESQQRRLFIQRVRMASGRHAAWDFQAQTDDTKRYVREQGAVNTKALARFPFVEPTPPDKPKE